MLPKILLPVLARILNQYLKLDLEMQQRLKKYNNRIIRATITTFDWTFFIKIHHEQLELFDACNQPIDAAFKADIITLMKAGFTDKAVISTEMELSGDVAMIHAVTAIFKAVEIDWEELLSNYTGDMIAHTVGQAVQQLKNFHQQIISTKKLNIKEYLQEEINLLVSRFEVEDFCNEVDLFRDDIERTAAKMQLIEKHDKKN